MPKESGDWKAGLSRRTVDEVEHIIHAFDRASDGRIKIGVARSDGRIDYLYAEGQILVRDEYFERALQVLEPETERHDRMRNDPGRVRRLIPGVTLFTLGAQFPTVDAALAVVDQQLGRGIATPDHVLTVAPQGAPCPATEPQEVYDEIGPYPSVCQDDGGTGVLIYMDDTGLLEDADATHPWLAGVQAGDIDPLPAPRGGIQRIPPYAGHGTFVAGVARCMAPAAEIIVTNVFSIAGSQLESNWIPRLEAALGLGVDIFHLTISAHSRHDFPLITFREWLKHLDEYGSAVCVVAAGNDGSRRLSWPAACSDVIAVGALGRDWHGRASFSNFGPWVDVYAPGSDLVNAFATGTYTCHVSPYKGQVRKFYGMTQWSGTSFSTPIVTGLIAARMSRTGENGQQAAAALLAEAQAQAIPGVGAVLLPCCNNELPTGHSPTCGCSDHGRTCGCPGRGRTCGCRRL
jgi:Subtilase family